MYTDVTNLTSKKLRERIRRVANKLNIDPNTVLEVVQTNANFVKEAMKSDTTFNIHLGKMGHFRRNLSYKGSRVRLNEFDRQFITTRDYINFIKIREHD